MPSEKRDRQRQNRQGGRAAQLEAAKAAKRRQSMKRTGIFAALLAVLVVVAAALAANNGDDEEQDVAAEGTSGEVTCNDRMPENVPEKKTYDAPPPMTIDPAKTYTATMETSCGDIVVALDPKAAPKTVNNFVFLAREDFYDGTVFHRVVDDFVIQGGSPDGTGTGDPGYEFEDELPTDGYQLGSLTMANSGPNTNGSQFFIVTGQEGTQLPNSYARFGKVTEGLEVAQKLESFAQQDQTPSRTLYLFNVEIEEG
ncbi:MAG: peptidylprolyl isomerase [Acidimicrobiia bacterium]